MVFPFGPEMDTREALLFLVYLSLSLETGVCARTHMALSPHTRPEVASCQSRQGQSQQDHSPQESRVKSNLSFLMLRPTRADPQLCLRVKSFWFLASIQQINLLLILIVSYSITWKFYYTKRSSVDNDDTKQPEKKRIENSVLPQVWSHNSTAERQTCKCRSEGNTYLPPSPWMDKYDNLINWL